LSISLSSPDIVRALIPTVAAALVNAVSTLGIAKSSALTHKNSPLKNMYTTCISNFLVGKLNPFRCQIDRSVRLSATGPDRVRRALT
jgi:hypothetical protein